MGFLPSSAQLYPGFSENYFRDKLVDLGPLTAMDSPWTTVPFPETGGSSWAPDLVTHDACLARLRDMSPVACRLPNLIAEGNKSALSTPEPTSSVYGLDPASILTFIDKCFRDACPCVQRSRVQSDRSDICARKSGYGIEEAIGALLKITEGGRPFFMRPVWQCGGFSEQVDAGAGEDSSGIQSSSVTAKGGCHHVVSKPAGCSSSKCKAEVESGGDPLIKLLDAFQKHQANVHGNCELSVVKVHSGDGHGSGCLLDRAGHVLTNNHVVKSINSFVTFEAPGFESECHPASVEIKSEENDLAVLKIEASKQKISRLFTIFGPVVFNKGNSPRVGHDVFTVGYPLQSEKVRTPGTIQGFPVNPIHIKHGEIDLKLPGVIQLNASILPGNSGGPLFNLNGHLIGVIVAFKPLEVGACCKRSVSVPIPVGYAIPLSTLLRFVNGVIVKEN